MIYVNTDIGYHFQLWFCKVIQRSPYNHLQNHAGSEEKMAAAPGYGTVLNLDNLPKNDPQKDNGDHVAKYGVCVCVCVCNMLQEEQNVRGNLKYIFSLKLPLCSPCQGPVSWCWCVASSLHSQCPRLSLYFTLPWLKIE